MKRKDLSSLAESKYRVIAATPMLQGLDVRESVTDRQERVPGFDQDTVRKSGIFVCGAGGLSAEQVRSLVRKGYGRIAFSDMDSFTPSNYSRQLCYADDLYRNKAVSMAKNLERESLFETNLLGLAMRYQTARQYIDPDDYAVFLSNVDNNEVRVDAARDCLAWRKPLVMCGVSEDANSGWIFVQKPGDACFGCAFPHKLNDTRQPCPGTPACVDILKVVGGLALYAIDSLLMDRPRSWNLRHVFLAGFIEDANCLIERNPDCELCRDIP